MKQISWVFDDNLIILGQFSISIHKNKCGYWLESPLWAEINEYPQHMCLSSLGDSNEYPQHMILSKNMKNYPKIINKHLFHWFLCVIYVLDLILPTDCHRYCHNFYCSLEKGVGIRIRDFMCRINGTVERQWKQLHVHISPSFQIMETVKKPLRHILILDIIKY